MSRLLHSSTSYRALCTLVVGAMAMLAMLTPSGCAEHGRMAIPGNAERIVGGSGRKVTTVATTRSARLYVLDRDDDSVFWAGDVHAGQTLVIDGPTRKVTLDGKTVAEGIVREHHYVVFLSQT